MNSNTDLFVDFKTLKTDQDTFDKIVQIKKIINLSYQKKLTIKSGKIFIIIIQTILTILLLITKII